MGVTSVTPMLTLGIWVAGSGLIGAAVGGEAGRIVTVAASAAPFLAIGAILAIDLAATKVREVREELAIAKAATRYRKSGSLDDWLRTRGCTVQRIGGRVYMLRTRALRTRWDALFRRMGPWNAVMDEDFVEVARVHRDKDEREVVRLLVERHDWKASKPARH